MSRSARKWHRRGWWLWLALMLASAYVINLYYQHHQQQLTDQYVQETETIAIDVERVLTQMQLHVRRLQQVAQLNLYNDDEPRELLQQLRAPESSEQQDVYTLDRWHQQSPQAHMGNVFLLGNPRAIALQKELRLVEALFPISASSHLSDSALQWSYYTSFVHRLTSIFPFRQYQGVLADAEVASLAAFYERYLPLERRRQAMRELATVQSPVWRQAHRDSAGAGWVMTLAAPVRYRGEVLGAVSADIRLSFLSAHLHRVSRSPERTMILDESMNILADSRQAVEPSQRLEKWLERMPVQLQQTAQRVSRQHPGWVEGDGMHFLARPLANSQWLMVRLIPTADLYFEARVRLLMLLLPLVAIAVIGLLLWYRYGLILQEREPTHDVP